MIERRLFLEGFGWRENIYVALIKRLLLVMLLFTLCRVGFYLFNMAYFPEMTFSRFIRIAWGGLRFDLTAVLYVNLLLIVMTIVPFDFRFTKGYQAATKYIFLTLNGVALATNVADFVYYRFTLRRTTADIFQQFENEGNLAVLSIRFLFDYWYAFFFWIGLVWLMIVLYNRIRIHGPQLKNRLTYYSLGVLFMPLVIYLFVAGVRGGFRHSTRPITISNAGEFVGEAKEVSIVLNTPFAILRTLKSTKIQKVQYFKDEAELEKLFSPVHRPVDSAAFRADNVVIIVLESFSKEFFGVFNRDKKEYPGYTPFLDSLTQHSKTFAYSFSNGRKSIDGLPSIVASIPSMGVPYVLTPFSNNKINSVGSLLRQKGYHTSFFHGAPNGSMGFNSFMNLAGFEHYYGMSEYNNDADMDGMWGIWDHKFFNFYADELGQFPQPFVSIMFSVSSHHPFKVPEEFEDRFKGGEQPILKCIEYTDYALKEFFEKASKMPWYRNTLFVITADHCSSNVVFPESRTTWGLWSIPIIFFKTDNSLAGEIEDELVQQIDIMPSVLGYLHFDKPYISFGRDIFREDGGGIVFNYREAYNLFDKEYLFSFDGQKALSLYDYKSDRMLTRNLLSDSQDIATAMETKLKAIIQQYNNRMQENRLVIE